MSITTDIAAAVIGLSLIGAIAWKVNSTMKENEELKAKLNTATAVTAAHADSGEIKNDQTEAIRKVEVVADRLRSDLAGLRKSLEQNKKSSANSLETCNRSLSVAGGVLEECGIRYLDVAKKAELVKVDLQAMDAHATVLEGIISDISGMEPIK